MTGLRARIPGQRREHVDRSGSPRGVVDLAAPLVDFDAASSPAAVPLGVRGDAATVLPDEETVERLRPEDGSRRLGTWLRRFGLHLEVATSLVAGVAGALLVHPDLATLAFFTAIWLIAGYHRGDAVTSPLARQLTALVRSSVLPVSGAAVLVAFAGSATAVIPQAIALSAGASATAGMWRLLRWQLQSPVRVVVVGDRVAVTEAVARWAGKSRVSVVAGVVVEPDLDADEVPAEIMGVPITDRLEGTTTVAHESAADLVVVSPGPGFTSTDFRRLGWSLQDSGVKYGVMGVLDTVAAHRIVPGGLGGATLMDVRSPRPSTWVRFVKAVVDRLAAAALLALLAPLLIGLMLAVRLDSRGGALFRQTRVGMNGRPFTVYKMRTMVDGADGLKDDLLAANEQDEVLFKMRRDPRVTRVGRFLRQSSLDELPQLFNVLRGEMSLVGPRPFLPAETAAMDPDTLRRLAVKPGITGLWQVSGRSDLTFREAADLDTFYADNWSLSGDLRICLRTVRAVVSGKGAY